MYIDHPRVSLYTKSEKKKKYLHNSVTQSLLEYDDFRNKQKNELERSTTSIKDEKLSTDECVSLSNRILNQDENDHLVKEKPEEAKERRQRLYVDESQGDYIKYIDVYLLFH
ncbi:hypothetical protein CHS0354_005238 [Potamilus streckersoni]|uniref:Uncharacterized protein n=1 Tax=Potamilus streckersoni TaxID=2493646 RepID=A0AAE0TKI9_9BIVA|nr:hypothetical protein CHS0354_005238 [Potamilus streckersoni]